MPSRAVAREAVRGFVLALVAALALGGCGTSQAELRHAQLSAALDQTLGQPVAFTLELDAEESALTSFGEAAGPLATLLGGSSARGVIDGDRLAFAVSLAGLDLAEVRVIAADELYARFDLAGLAELMTGEPASLEAELAAALTEEDVADDVTAAVLATARGEWVRLDTEPVAGDSASVSMVAALRALLESADAVNHLGRLEGEDAFDGEVTLEVSPAEAARAVGEVLAGLDADGAVAEAPSSDDTVTDAGSTVRVAVSVTGGVIRTVAVGLADLLEALAPDAGEVDARVVLTLQPLGDVDLVRAPLVAGRVSVADLSAAAALIGERLDALSAQPPG